MASTGMGTTEWAEAVAAHAEQAMQATLAAAAAGSGPNLELGTLQVRERGEKTCPSLC